MNALLLAGGLGGQIDSIFAGFDYAVFSFFGNIQDPFLTVLAKCFTALGSETFIILMAVMGIVMIFFKRTRKVGIALVFAIAIGTLITNVIIKPAALRIRPYNTLQADAQYWAWYVGAGMFSESDYCFPSGHTTGATEVMIVLLFCHAKSKRKTARALCWIFPVIALFVGASRIYLMVHYATDVLAGFIIGIFAGAIGFLIASLILRKAERSEERQALLAANVRPLGIAAIALGFVIAFISSYLVLISGGGENALRCSYDGEYKCQNEADEKNRASDGKCYCDIHWNELMNGQ